MRIEQFDARIDADQVRACYEIVAAGQRLDDPGVPVRSLTSFRNRWTSGFSGEPRQTWLGVDAAGDPVGCYQLTLPEVENPTLSWCNLAVDPARRRGGAGRELLAHCLGQAQAAGRARLTSDVRDGSPGAAFAEAAGATSGIAEVMRRLDINAELTDRLPRLRTAAQQEDAGYSLVSWVGASAPENLDDQARLSAAMADAPRDEGVDAEAWDADRILDLERTCLGSGQQFYSVAARHEATGRLVAITQIFTDPGTPDWGFQMITAVLPAHRGHGLGLLVKAEMLGLLTTHEPSIQHIITGNADSNRHMVAINEQLGFTVVSVRRSWELPVTAA